MLEGHLYIDEDRTGKTRIGRESLDALIDTAKGKKCPFQYILVNDVSRFGRNKADLFAMVDILTYHQIYLYFVLDGLDSQEAWFEGAFHNKAQQASEFSKSLSHNVKRGREGRFLAGYNPGGGCYGYKNVPDEDLTQRGEYGRP